MESPDPVERPVLVLDFGAQYVQLIARRVRERHAFARIVRHDMHGGAGPRARPAGPDPLGRPGERLRARVRRGATRGSSTWACRSWGSATGCNSPARPWGARSRPTRPRVRPRRVPRPRRRTSRCSTTSRADDRLDEPRRPGPGRRAATSSRWRRRRPARSPRSATAIGRSTASSSTPRSPTPRMAR